MLSNLWAWAQKQRLLAAVLAIAILIGLALGWNALGDRRQTAAERANLQIAAIQRGNLTATIGATGSLRANQSAQLNWESSGNVEVVKVEVGERVEAGEILAALQLPSLPQNVILAQTDLKNAQDELERFYDSYGPLGLAEAERTLAEARDALEDAERQYNYTVTVAPQVDIDQAFANMILAGDKLDKAKDNFEPYANKPEDNLVRATLQSRLAQAQKDYDRAVRLYNSFNSPGTATEIAIAQAELALAQAKFEEAEEDYQEVLDGPNAEDIAAAEARVAAALATLGQASIAAPFSGVITDAYPLPGDRVSAGLLAFQLDDLSRLLVDVEVSEVDINRVKVGQRAMLSFDAVPEREYEGRVVAVALAGNSQQGAVNFRVTVELTDADENVRPGMTAAVNIVVTELEDVLLVPNRAVRFLDGKRVVYVLGANGELQAVPITLGASSESFSEIAAGNLQAGDSVVLNPPTISFEPGSGPPPFVNGGGGFNE